MKPKRTVKMSLRKTSVPRRTSSDPIRSRAAEIDYEVEDCETEAEPNMRFSHALFVVLVLHVIAVAGVFAFNSIKARQETADSAKGAAQKSEKAKVAETKEANSSAAPATPKATPAALPRRTHIVVAGDTLSKIASAYRTTVEALTSANGISATSIIRIGQELVIPEPGYRPPSPAGEKKKPALATVVATARPPTERTPAASLSPSANKPTPAPTQAQAATSAPSSQKPAPTPAPTAQTQRPADGVYVVAKGDNPYSIARRFGVSYKQLLEINKIEDPTKVPIGQKLKLPPSP